MTIAYEILGCANEDDVHVRSTQVDYDMPDKEVHGSVTQIKIIAYADDLNDAFITVNAYDEERGRAIYDRTRDAVRRALPTIWSEL